MKLYEAIEYAISQHGIDIIRDKQFANYLADLQAYETPGIRSVVDTIIRESYCEKLYEGLTSDSYRLAFDNISNKLTNTFGFQESIVKFVLDSLLYATHNTSIEPFFEYNQKEEDSKTKNKQIAKHIVCPKRNFFIDKKDIEDFFELETENEKTRWEATMKLSIKERVRKRKAIQNVFLDRDYRGISEEKYILLRVTMRINLADFKEGECLILHEENTLLGIKCRLNAFEDDNTIILEVYPLNMPSDIDDYYDKSLVLDKDIVDLRYNVYFPFIVDLPNSSDDFWNKLILNSCPKPTFENKEKCEKFLKETLTALNLSLLPKQEEAILNCMQAKNYYLIQGPPGTGKSFVLGIVILEELFDLKHNVIVTGPNHMAINNAMGQFLKFVPQYSGVAVKVGQAYNAPTKKVKYKGEDHCIQNLLRIDCNSVKYYNRKYHQNLLIGLTPYCLYTSRARGLKCDTLIIDEAGQMTTPLALMAMIKAKKIIFAGDHKQLPPIVSSNIVKAELKQSVFQALISDENSTMLDTSFRMCEPICNYVSELFYDGHLKAMKHGHSNALVCDDPLYSFNSPVILHEEDDEGEQVSDKEATFIANVIAGFLAKGINAKEIAVLSPFRAQAANIRRAIKRHKEISKEDYQLIISETIDKMQGQESEIILYSLTSGNVDYMSEMAEFLYNPNKMNVAFSRAKSKLIIVGSLSKLSNLNLPEYPHINKMLNSKYVTRI